MTRFRGPKGIDDILPPRSRVWVRAELAFLELSARFGYGPAITPLFEATELFARGVGESTEVVEKQMYTFTDKGGRSLTLRPEATASIVRAVIEAGGTAGVMKASYWGPMFRYERPQAGRRRQFHQAGVEYLGEPAPEADLEVIEFGYRYLEELGVADVEVRLNSIGDAADREAYRAELTAFLEERIDLLSADARRRVATNPLRVLDSKVDADVVATAPVPLDHLGPAAFEHFERVKAGLERLGIPYVLAPRLVRGLDYYNRTVFEYVPRGYGAAQNAVGGGGRYDGLFELLGGKPTPAVGLAMGVDRIILAMGEETLPRVLDVFVVHAGPAWRNTAVELTSRLRREGLRVDIDLGDRTLRAQFKQADRRGARGVIVVGEEWEGGRVTVKDLETGEQREIPVEEIETWALRH